jgi:hypothetical protein
MTVKTSKIIIIIYISDLNVRYTEVYEMNLETILV